MGEPFRGQHGAGKQYGSQHSQSVESSFAQFPGIKVVSPATPYDAKGLLVSAIRDPNPVLVLENEVLYGIAGPVPKVDDWLVPIGKARIARAGRDVTIVSFARGMLHTQDGRLIASTAQEGLLRVAKPPG